MTSTGAIVDAAVKIHIDLGPGLLESVYETDIHAESIDTQAAGPIGTFLAPNRGIV